MNKIKAKINLHGDPEDVNVTRRFMAYLADWLLGMFFVAFPVVMLYSTAMNTTTVTDDLIKMVYPYNYIGGALALLFSLIYFVIIPWKLWKGQTPGKRMFNIKIVKNNDDDVDLKALLLRQIVGMVLLESVLFTTSNYILKLLTLVSGEIKFMQYPYYVGLIITLISFLLVGFSRSRRAIHDYLGNTKVVMIADNRVPNPRKED